MFEFILAFILSEPPRPPEELMCIAPLEELVVRPPSMYDSCVRTARYFSPFHVPRIDAIDFEPNSKPLIGALVLFKYGETAKEHHVGVIDRFEGTGFFVHEGNYNPGEYSYRFVEWSDPSIRGFYKGEKQEIAYEDTPNIQVR